MNWFEKNDGELAEMVQKTDKNSFWPLCRTLLDLGFIHEFYDMTPPKKYPFGPGRIKASPEQGVDAIKLSQAVRDKWFEITNK